jgi:hypothetical protein
MNVSGNGQFWTWICQGANGGPSAVCQVPILITGLCGSGNGKNLTAPPTGAAACASGIQVMTSAIAPYSWICQGQNGGPNSQPCSSIP